MTKRPCTCGATDGWQKKPACQAGSSAILVGSRARVIAPDQSERQQVPLVGSVVVVDQAAAQPGVKAFELRKDFFRSDGARSEGRGQRDVSATAACSEADRAK